jgi:hypothetical protein
MQADHVLRAPREAAMRSRSRVEVFEARIAPGFMTSSRRRNTALLHGQVLEHGLDDDVGLGDVGVVQGARDQRQALLALRGVSLPFLTVAS